MGMFSFTEKSDPKIKREKQNILNEKGKGREEKLVALGCNGKKEEQDNPTAEIKT